MPTIKLTQPAVNGLKPPASGRVEYWDSQLPGFGLRISAPRPGQREGRRTWQAFYRVKDQPGIIRETIGTVATIPKVDEARDLARVSIRAAKQGVNPIKKRRADLAKAERENADRERDTLGAVIDRYIAKLPTLGKRRPRRPEYVEEVQRALRVDVRDKLGADLPIRDITKRQIRDLLDAIVQRGKSGRAAPSHANHVLAYLRALLNWAASEEIIDANPAAGIEAPAPMVQRDRVLDDDEIRLFWLACDEIGHPFGPLFKLLLLTAQRRDELADATWAEFDTDKSLWTLPRKRTKNDKAHLIHLSQPALDILAKLPRVGDKGYLFSTTGKTAVSGFGHARQRLVVVMLKFRKTGGAIEPFTLHDLRRTAATGMAGIGIAHHVLDKVLNHGGGAISGVASIYNRHEYLAERKAALDAWARHIEGLIAPQTSNVVELGARR